MSTGSGTTRRVLRSLDHLRADTRNKFIRKVRPSYYQKTAVWVAPKDRVTFWNIVPGDAVKLRTGAVAHDENGKPIRGEGIVTSVDRTTNRLWLRDAKVCAPSVLPADQYRMTSIWRRRTSNIQCRV